MQGKVRLNKASCIRIGSETFLLDEKMISGFFYGNDCDRFHYF